MRNLPLLPAATKAANSWRQRNSSNWSRLLPERGCEPSMTGSASRTRNRLVRRSPLQRHYRCASCCWGFKLKAPQYIHNRGEIYNLSISRGTLTEEERYIINDHIVQTIIMLSQLPFPKHLNMCRKLPAAIMKKSMAVDTRNACDKMK